jgi:AcrR family transcriptional regulator
MSDQTLDRHPARRQEIVAAAHAIATEDGWQGVSVRRVAARVGCSAAALYQYLPDKESILRSIAADGENRLGQVLKATSAERGRVRRLRAAARAYLGFVRDQPEVYRVMHGLDGVPRLGDSRAGGPAGAALASLAAGLIEKYCLAETATDLAERLLALFHGHAALALSAREPDWDRAAGLLSRSIEDVLHGMARR